MPASKVKTRVRCLVYEDNRLARTTWERRTVYRDARNPSPYINDTLHGCKVYLTEEDPPTYRVDAYMITPGKPFLFKKEECWLGLRFRGLYAEGDKYRAV